MNHTRFAELGIGTKEDSGSENPFEGGDQSAVFLAAFLHTERVEHFGATAESHGPALLPDGQRRQKDGYDSVLSERQAVLRMACHLEQKMSVTAFKQQLPRRRPAYGQTAKNERARTESEILVP